ncbi:MAG: PaaX family transcriptional regulator C-terminal domain-containing protein [Pseudomonadota bacterium]
MDKPLNSLPGDPVSEPVLRMRELIAPRLKSLLVTLWGDAILPHGGRVWLGCLPGLLAPLGFDEGAVRVSLQRLVAEGWLISEEVGRKRDLRLAPGHMAETRRVQAAIYRDAPPDWDGSWFLLQVAAKSAASREALRRVLSQQGFAAFSPNVYLHPHADWPQIARVPGIAAHLDEVTAAFAAREVSGRTDLAALWDLPAIRARWLEIGALLDLAASARGAEARFACRVLLIHAVRRLVLAQPSLPAALVAADWPEAPMRRRLAEVYPQLAEASRAWLDDHLLMSDGARPAWHGFEPPRFGRSEG